MSARRQSVSISAPLSISPPAGVLSTSPTLATSPGAAGYSSFSQSYEARRAALSTGGSLPFPQAGKALSPFPQHEANETRILLLENVNTSAVDMLKAQGWHVEEVKKALDEDELIARLKDGGFSAVGIRSKTKITAKVISEVPSVRPARGGGLARIARELPVR